jgi:ring-1,2-phenylacetyl-CoA epoxidase subunit PaaD
MGEPTRDEILQALRTVNDPEVPVSIVDLGLVYGIAITETAVDVELVPTYRSCPAKALLANAARQAILAAVPQHDVAVRWSTTKTWNADRMSTLAREKMREFGIAVSDDPTHIACPHCGSDNVQLDNQFGCAVCKSLYYCTGCQNAFEVMRGTMVMANPGNRANVLGRRTATVRGLLHEADRRSP